MASTYTSEQMELLSKVEQLQQEKNISQNEAGKLIGISGTALSQLKSGKYPANPQKLFDAMARYFGVKERARLTYSEIPYVPTSISSQIYDIIGACQVKGGLAIAAGDAGIGKTKVAQKFVQDNPSNSVLITINPCLTSMKSILKLVAEKVGAAPERSCDELWFSITKKLSDSMVLIFDESQHLTIKGIETLRSFSDYFSDKGQTLGICFIGNPETVIHMSRRAEFAQISNRTKQRKIYTRDLIQRDDIKKLFPILAEEHREKEIDLLYVIAQTPQAIRGAINVFSNAYDNEDYSYSGLIAMAKFMDIAV